MENDTSINLVLYSPRISQLEMLKKRKKKLKRKEKERRKSCENPNTVQKILLQKREVTHEKLYAGNLNPP